MLLNRPRCGFGRALTAAALLLLPGATLPAAPARTLGIAAAANLKNALEEAKEAFEAERPGVEIALSLGASGALFAQIQNGAPFDLFLSADREYPRQLVAAGLAAAADERVYAFGKLVVWLPRDSDVPVETRGLAALADPRVRRIAIANPAVAPFGRATEQALASAGVLAAVKDKLVLGTSVGQAAQFATTGAADAAFLPLSLTRSDALAAGRIVPVPERHHPRIEQSGAVLASAREPGLARDFLAFLRGAKGRALLARHGYGLP